jgi:hypothetical protein
MVCLKSIECYGPLSIVRTSEKFRNTACLNYNRQFYDQSRSGDIKLIVFLLILFILVLLPELPVSEIKEAG